jgi:hypothetical protein
MTDPDKKSHLSFEEVLRAKHHRMQQRGHLSRYRSITDQGMSSFGSENCALQEEEWVLGIYENSVEDMRSNVVITTKGIYVFLNRWRFIPYGQIRRVRVQLDKPQDKTTARMMVLELETGEWIDILISGGQGRLRDIWPFSHFVGAVVAAWQKRSRLE